MNCTQRAFLLFFFSLTCIVLLLKKKKMVMPLKTEERGRVRVYACRSSACDNNNKAWLLRCFNAAISALLDAILVFFFLLTHLCCLLALSLCCLTLAPVSVFLSPLTLSCPFFLLFSVFFFFSTAAISLGAPEEQN